MRAGLLITVVLGLAAAGLWLGLPSGWGGSDPDDPGRRPGAAAPAERPVAADPLPQVAAPQSADIPDGVATAPTPSAVSVPRAVQPIPRSEIADVRGMLELPGGMFVPMLNGVEYTKSLVDAWPKSIPWSPIVGIVREANGIEWYAHQDGSRSTTQMAWEDVRGEMIALTRVANPAAAPVGPAPAGSGRVAPGGRR